MTRSSLERGFPDSWKVPTFDSTAYADKASEYCVCVPVLNEGERIKAQLVRMQAIAKTVDIIIADGGSTDGALSDETLSSCGVKNLLVKTGPGKLSAQLRMAFAFALGQGYRGIVIVDGNNKDDPAAIPDFVTALRAGYDHVQGSRFIPGGHEANTPAARLWGIKLIHAPLISMAARFRYTDTTNGFRAYSRDFLLDSRVQPFREVFSKYELHYYLAIRAARMGFRVKEIPVSRSYPASGQVPTKISGWQGNAKIMGTLLKSCIGCYNPPKIDKQGSQKDD